METHTYKSGTNRGNRRIWIEGDRLTRNGIRRGVKFTREHIGTAQMVLTFSGEGRHTVAGTADRPILDLNGKYLNEFFGDAEGFRATFIPAADNAAPQITIDVVETV